MPCDLPSGPSIGDRRLTCANASSAGVQGLLGLAGGGGQGGGMRCAARVRGVRRTVGLDAEARFSFGVRLGWTWGCHRWTSMMDGGDWGVKLAGEFSCGSVGV